MKIKKGDKIKVMTGKDKGREGKVERVYSKQNKILVSGVNLYKRHIKKSDQAPQGGVVEVPRPLDIAKIALICPKCGKVTRVSYINEKGKKLRICKKCKSKFT
ncbi:50S ribosomal protein L24 [Candidatus Roizmanbacteria bacterium]|nr:50S ribosomal protein L24 [Candidatus Roizmanbacteria bacterium]